MKNLIIIGPVFPEPSSTAAGKRMLQLIDLFLEMDFRISFLSAANVSEFSHHFDNAKVEFFPIKLNDDSFDNLMDDLKPDIVLYDRYISEEQFGWRVSKVFPDAMTILDTEDLHFLRKSREQAFKKNEILNDSDLITDDFKREMASIYRCDLSLIVSEYEMQLLTEHFMVDASILHYIPLYVKDINHSDSTYADRKNFISIGNFLHEPNWQTVLQLKKIWPLIRAKLPDANLNIYGAYAPEKAKRLHNKKNGFLIKGRATFAKEVFDQSRVLLAPIPFGAGIKGKLLESMEFGLPNITSTIGAEAMCGDFPWNGAVKDDLNEFAEAAVQLYKDEQHWTAAQENGYQIVQHRFMRDKFANNFKEIITELSNNLKNHRTKNYFGQILQHHTLQSTKYMSQWIMEKNRRL